MDQTQSHQNLLYAHRFFSKYLLENDHRVVLSSFRANVDLGRTESLRGITVLRGQIPGTGTTAESYL
jgi:PII-like signaling protein